jgi:hypothetical protein
MAMKKYGDKAISVLLTTFKLTEIQ